jgi:16S rRNA (cytosine1402-N4)-methyltransferase
MKHIPVLEEEVVRGFHGSEIRVFFDGTLGAGGHADAILSAHPEIEIYVGCDRDPSALQYAAERLAKWSKKMRFVHGNFLDVDAMLRALRIKKVDGFFLI